MTSAAAHDESKYPDWSGQWLRPKGVGINWDQDKRPGLAQQAPLKPKYQKILEASLEDQRNGGQGIDNRYTCMTNGMPRMMAVIGPIEWIILPQITYVHFEAFMPRRIYTDGRDFPKDEEPSFAGYSIGKWSDTRIIRTSCTTSSRSSTTPSHTPGPWTSATGANARSDGSKTTATRTIITSLSARRTTTFTVMAS